MYPVLILDGTPRVVLAIARSLREHGIEVDFASFRSRASTPLPSRLLRDRWTLSDPESDAAQCWNELEALLDTNNWDMLIPTTDQAMLFACKHYDALSSRLHVAMPRPHIVNRVLDKSVTLRIARECGISVPAQLQLNESTDLAEFVRTAQLPLICKPRNKGEDSRKVQYIHNAAELAYLASEPGFAETCLVQPYIRGVGVGVEMMMHEGRALAACQHRRIKELPHTGGVSVVAVSEPLDPKLFKMSEELLVRIGWSGPAMVEFRYDPESKAATLMEVNGRYWGSLPLTRAIGLDIPYYQWQLAHGELPRIPSQYPAGVRMRWVAGEVFRLRSLIASRATGDLSAGTLLREHANFLLDFGRKSRPAVWSWRDPLPAIAEIAVPNLRAVRRLMEPVRGLFKDFWVYRKYGVGVGARVSMARARVRRSKSAFGLRATDPVPQSVLFVCAGNILRSPFASEFLRETLAASGNDAIRVMSAGLEAKPGGYADPRGIQAAQHFNISLRHHRVAAVSSELVAQSDVIFVMDLLNLGILSARFPEARGKAVLLGTGDKNSIDSEIKDPYQGAAADVTECYNQISSCISRIATTWLRAQKASPRKFAARRP